MNIILFPF